MEDLTTRYRITATTGDGGIISPAGITELLERMAARYTIKPKTGYFIQDVKVDGASVGSVPAYTFDPVHANHAIEVTFAAGKAPVYTITASSNDGGAITPSGAIEIAQGGAQAFAIAPKPGLAAKSLTVDGVEIGARDSLCFSDVRNNHTITASFACRIAAEAGFGGTISPCGDVTTNYGDNLTFKIAPIPGYSIAAVTVDGKAVDAKRTYNFSNVTASHTISVKFKGGITDAGKIPKTDQLILACLGESLPAKSERGDWPTRFPEDGKLTPISTPETVSIDGR